MDSFCAGELSIETEGENRTLGELLSLLGLADAASLYKYKCKMYENSATPLEKIHKRDNGM